MKYYKIRVKYRQKILLLSKEPLVLKESIEGDHKRLRTTDLALRASAS